MIVTENTIDTVIREIDSLKSAGKLSNSNAEDLSSTVAWITGKQLNESNIQHVINELRGFKKIMDKTSVCHVINAFRFLMGVEYEANKIS